MPFRNSLLATIVLATAAVAFQSLGANAEINLKTVSFGGATNLQSWVAQDRGFFAREGLNVDLSRTRGSAQEVRDLLSGKFDIMSSAFDNTAAYMQGQGETPLDGASDLVVFMGVHSGLNSLVARPEINTAADLRGKTVAVDALKTGYALVLYKLLQTRGLDHTKDYSAIAVGSTEERMQALQAGKAAAAMLSAPVDSDAEKKGYHILADSRELGPYQGSVYVTRRSWAKLHRSELSAYIRAIAAATDYIFANKAGAIDVLKKHQPHLSAADVDQLYAILTGHEGFDPHAEINMEGVKTVLALRAAYGQPPRKPEPASAFIDQTYYRDALAQKTSAQPPHGVRH